MYNREKFILWPLLLVPSESALTPSQSTTTSSVSPTRVTTSPSLISNDPSELALALEDFPAGWQLQRKGAREAGYETYFVKVDVIPVYPDVVVSWAKVFPSSCSWLSSQLASPPVRGRGLKLMARVRIATPSPLPLRGARIYESAAVVN